MKTALITGANKGIGFEVARQLAQNGFYVYIDVRNLQNGQTAVAKLQAEGITTAEALTFDVTDQASVDTAAATLAGKIEELDVLVNNAGISGGFPNRR